jgi:glutathione S-transferase
MEEAGMTYTGIEVSWDKNSNVAELEKLNPLGVAPVLVSEQGKTLTQNVAILEFIADSKPSAHLLAEKGTWERAETMSWLSFVASDFHKAFVPLFAADAMSTSDAARAEIKSFAVKNINGYLEHLDKNLAGKDYLMGKQFTIADSYLFVVLGWCKWMDIKTDGYKNVSSYMSRVFERPAVQKVMKIEDLLD